MSNATLVDTAVYEKVRDELITAIKEATKSFRDLEHMGMIAGTGDKAQNDIAEFAARQLDGRFKPQDAVPSDRRQMGRSSLSYIR